MLQKAAFFSGEEKTETQTPLHKLNYDPITKKLEHTIYSVAYRAWPLETISMDSNLRHSAKGLGNLRERVRFSLGFKS